MALHPVIPARQERLRLVTSSRDAHVLRVGITEAREYSVPPNGEMTLDIPAYRQGCDACLLGICLHGVDPFKAKRIDVISGAKTVRKLSLQDIVALPRDPEGYHLLRIGRTN
jgi:hypothetical protein